MSLNQVKTYFSRVPDTHQRGRCSQQQVWRIQADPELGPEPGPDPGSEHGSRSGSGSTCSVSSFSSISPEETTADRQRTVHKNTNHSQGRVKNTHS